MIRLLSTPLGGTIGGSVAKQAWYDKNDDATSTTPISHTGGAADTFLTNDGLGAFTNSFDPASVGSVWDTANNEFDFSGLEIGDWVLIRFDVTSDLSVVGQVFSVVMDVAIGSAAPYTLSTITTLHRATGPEQNVWMFAMYIGDANTRDFPSKPRFVSADDASIQVNGWVTFINKMGVP